MRESGVRGFISEAAVRPASSRSAYDVPSTCPTVRSSPAGVGPVVELQRKRNDGLLAVPVAQSGGRRPLT